MPMPERLKFSVVCIEDEQTPIVHRNYSFLENILDLELPVKMETVLHDNAKRPYAMEENISTAIPDRQYQLKIRYNGKTTTEFPDGNRVFLYGQGGIGKTTLLLKQIKENSKTTCFYFLLYRYK